jgi:hypothetical protein
MNAERFMCLSFEQQKLALATSVLWPPERLSRIAASSDIPVQIITSIFDYWANRAARARAARLATADRSTLSPKPKPEGVSVATYAEAHGLSVPTVYEKIRAGLIVAVKTGGKMMVQQRR